ncbi:MAG: FAD-dependent oxidoreductase [Parvularculaceae bacterium]|nr:FAD-dependent oxidoreductase [Parvularculaceae bacterium]
MPYTFSREITILDGYDLVVAGGGPAGCGAAIAAARKGLRVLLIEATGALGGMGTQAMVSAWSHLSDGHDTVIGGLMLELVETMYQRGFIPPKYDRVFWTRIHNRGLGYSTEGLKLLLDELCESAGVDVRFFTRLVEAEASGGQVGGVIIHDGSGLSFVQAPYFVDATGDASLSFLAGAQTRRAGRDTPNINPPTLCSAHAGVDHDVFDRRGQQPFVDKAVDEGFFTQPDRHVPGLFPSGNSTATLNAGHLFGVDALDPVQLSGAMRTGRRLAWEYGRFCREYLPGCEDIELVATATLLGVRESRRVVGEYELCYQDYLDRRTFDDQIAVYCKQVDIHVYDLSDAEYERYQAEYENSAVLAPGESYGIPYRCLVPKGFANLWVAGRSNSSDTKVAAAIRDQPAAVMMGEAAGTAAVQAMSRGEAANSLDTLKLRTALREAGGNN